MNIHVPSADGRDPYDNMILDVHKGISNIALCSVWMISSYYKIIDYSIPYDRITVTFLVPIPKLISDAAAIYYSLDGDVWLAFIFCLLCLSCLLTVASKLTRVEKKEERSLLQFIFYLIEIATGQGIPYSPSNFFIRHLLIRLV